MILLATIFLLGLGPGYANPHAPTERFALFVGANVSNDQHVKSLKYAERDASALASVLSELGNLSNGNTIILRGPDRYGLLSSIQQINRKILASRSGNRKEFVFYYSGHSNTKGLMLKDGTLTFNLLRSYLKTIRVDLRLEILDSCESGSFLRTKGKKHPFVNVINSNENIKGHVSLASSSSNEASQESDIIHGSYFTHFLISALRGAGDVSGDQKVSLNEAYRFAYDKTYANTASSEHGPQHAEYAIELSGQGDYILTDLRSSGKKLNLDKSIRGNIFISNTVNTPIAELDKKYNESASIVLPKGKYHLIVIDNGKYYRSNVVINSTVEVTLRKSDFSAFTPKLATQKGVTHLSRIKDIMHQSSPIKSYMLSLGTHNESFIIHSYSPGETAAKTYTVNSQGLYLAFYANVLRRLKLGGEYHTSGGDSGVQGFSSNALFTVFSWDTSKRSNISLLLGVGYYQDTISKFYDDHTVYTRNNDLIKLSTLQGTHIPLMLNMSGRRFYAGLGVLLRDSLMEGEKNNIQMKNPVFQLNTGVKF